MALPMVVKTDDYIYTEPINSLDATTIAKSRDRFVELKKAGVIITGEYDDPRWIMSNEVTKNATISFRVQDIHFANVTQKKLNCTLHDYQAAMRVVITSRFMYALDTLQNDSRIMRQFADKLTIPQNYAGAQLLSDLLSLLPGSSDFRVQIQDQIDDIPQLSIQPGNRRKLAHYQSYLKLGDIIDHFWSTATDSEKEKYFPIWFWYRLTSVLPLRPTECVLTPRDCIRQDGADYYLTIRRTRLKGSRQASSYTIASDYEMMEYPIPEKLASPILEYISATKVSYLSDIDVLFCKTTQFTIPDTPPVNDHHYTYANLRQCLFHFYDQIVSKKMGYAIVCDTDRLEEKEIELVRLGDARHIAMIGLVISGGSPTICKELAGHTSIATSSHYYGNLTTFLDVLGYERFREMESQMTQAYGIQISQVYPVENGYCQNQDVWNGNYTPCESAVNANGLPGSCTSCCWFFPKRGSTFKNGGFETKDAASLELKQTCSLLKQSLDLLSQQLGNTDTLSSILDKLAAQARQFVLATAIEKIADSNEVDYL